MNTSKPLIAEHEAYHTEPTQQTLDKRFTVLRRLEARAIDWGASRR